MLYESPSGNEPFAVGMVTPNTFHFLGVPALFGRVITGDDARPGASLTGVLSYQAWMTHFGGDKAVLGRTIVLDKHSITIVGVMPPHFNWNIEDIWIPDAAQRSDPDAMKKAFWLQARLKPGITLQAAAAQLNIIAKRLAKVYPDLYPKQFTIKVITVIDAVVGKFRWVLYTLFGAVGLLLLIACCNVANMLLARATAREREIAIRGALGAQRFQIFRQLLVESLLLALAGGAVGVAIAYAGTKALRLLIPPYTIPVETVISVSVPVLFFSLGIAILTALLFGAAPALHATRRDLASGLSSAGKGAGGGFNRGGLRNLLVISEVALSLVLLAGAGILMRSFLSMVGSDLGFNPHNLVVARAYIPNATDTQKHQFYQDVMQRLNSMPGVIAAGGTTGLPPYGGIATDIEIPGKLHTEQWKGMFELCDESYFRTIGFRLLRGSLLSEADIQNARKVAIVNETLARKYFGSDDPIGRRIQITRLASGPNAIPDATFEVIGVVADIRNQDVEEPSLPEAFIPATISSMGFPTVLVRTAVDPEIMLHAITQQIRSINKAAILRDSRTLDRILHDSSYSRPRFSVWLLSIFGTIGLVLVGSGVYGVIAYSVSRQTREIGIRMALGAERRTVFLGVLRMTLRLFVGGIVIGSAASFATNRIIANSLWSVPVFDPVVLAGGIAVIMLLGFAACFVPALRATRVNPVVALRQE
jgi:predicted permease